MISFLLDRRRNRDFRGLLPARASRLVATGAAAVALAALVAPANATNTTLRASKSLEICAIDLSTWRYSGVVSVTNTGSSYATTGLTLYDWIFHNGVLAFTVPGSGATPVPKGNLGLANPADPDFVQGNIKPGGSVLLAYFVERPPLDLRYEIKNKARVTITNHAGIPRINGPTVTATWDGFPPLCTPIGCTRTIGYWKTHEESWPLPLQDKPFYSSGATWLTALQGGPTQSSGFWILARAYIGAVLNRSANGGTSPVDTRIAAAEKFFEQAGPSLCEPAGSCGAQNAFAGRLQTYNEGKAGIPHCR